MIDEITDWMAYYVLIFIGAVLLDTILFHDDSMASANNVAILVTGYEYIVMWYKRLYRKVY